jgi:hypothetical protein
LPPVSALFCAMLISHEPYDPARLRCTTSRSASVKMTSFYAIVHVIS